MQKKVLKSLTAIAGIAISLPTIVIHGHETNSFINNANNQISDKDLLRHQGSDFRIDQQHAPQHTNEKQRKLKSIGQMNHRERVSRDIRRLSSEQTLFLQILESEMQQQEAFAATENDGDDDEEYYVEAEGDEQIDETDDGKDDEILKFFNTGSATNAFRQGPGSKGSKSSKASKAPKSTKAPKSINSDPPTFSPSPSISFSPSPSITLLPSTFSPSPSISFSPSPTTTSKEGGPSMIGKGGPSMMGKGVPSMEGKGGPSMVGKGGPSMVGKGGPSMIGKGASTKKGKGRPSMRGKGGPSMIGKGGPSLPGKGSSKSSPKIVASDFPTFTPTPSISFSDATLSPSPSSSFSVLPVTTLSPVPTGSAQPTSCQDSKTIVPKDKSSKSSVGKGMMRGGKGMMSVGKGRMSVGKGMMSGGSKRGKGSGKGTGGSKKGIDCPEPTFSPSPSSTNVPTVTALPTSTLLPTSDSNCRPTSGTCVRSANALERELANANARDVVALCGDSTITVDEVIFLTQDFITICCQGVDCTLLGSGSDSLLVVQGRSVTLQDIRFEDGVSSLVDGGNVAIQANGDHTIIRSEFINGATDQAGGNLFVETFGTLTIINSTFVDGVAGTAGGGLAVLDASSVVVIGATFVNNVAPNGGGFYSAIDPTSATRSNEVIISSSLFNANSAENGGGFFISFVDLLGTTPLPIAAINSNNFFRNKAKQGGGAGLILNGLDNIDVTISSNTGSSNTAASGFCPDFLTLETDLSITPNCIAVNDQYP